MIACSIGFAVFAVVITVRVVLLQWKVDRLEGQVQADRSAAVLARAQQVAKDVERECSA